MKIIYAGTPEFAAVALHALYAAGHDIRLVLTQPDRPAGRGLQLQASAVKQAALARGTPLIQPISLRLDGKYPEVAHTAHARLRQTPHDVMIVAAYGLILPPDVLAIPRLGCINIHASLLPRWRGAAPIQRAIEAGDAETGVTIMQMERGLDTGPMLLRQALPIADHDTSASLHDKLAVLGGTMIVEALIGLEQGKLPGIPQAQQGVNYAAKIGKEEAALDFRQSAGVLARKIRAFNPFPGASAQFGTTTVKLWQAHALPGHTHAAPGSILAANTRDGVRIACGEGILQVMELQKSGGKRLSATEFLKGFALDIKALD